MSLNFSPRVLAAFGVLAAALAGCNTLPGRQRDQSGAPMHRGPTTGAGYSGSMGSGTGSGACLGQMGPGQMGPGMGGNPMGDRKSMCVITSSIAHANSPQERDQLLDRYFKGMSAQMREEHLALMREQCGQ
jgi:predicted small secreted protein